TRGEGRDPQLPPWISPADARHRKVIVDEKRLRLDIGPARDARIGEDERLDRESASGDFERAVLGDQPRFLAAVDPDQRPVRLLTGEAARIAPARCLTRECSDERVGCGAEAEIAEP